MKSTRKSFRLAAMLMILTIITGVIVLLMTVSLTLFSLSINQRRIAQDAANTSFATVDGCAEEALQHLRHNFAYSGETLSLNNLTCTIVIINTGLNPTVTVTASNTDFIRKLQMTVVLYPTFSISSWQELTT